MMHADKICFNYNCQVETMMICDKKRNAEDSRCYWQAFTAKRTIESTLKCLGLMLVFDNKGNAVDIEVIPS